MASRNEYVDVKPGGSPDQSRYRKQWQEGATYSLVDVVCAELNSRIGDNADAVGAVASHEAAPTLLPPHFGEGLGDRHFVLVAADALDLEEDLEALEGRDDGARDGARNTAGDEGSEDGLGKDVAGALEGSEGRGSQGGGLRRPRGGRHGGRSLCWDDVPSGYNRRRWGSGLEIGVVEDATVDMRGPWAEAAMQGEGEGSAMGQWRVNVLGRWWRF